MESIDGWWYVVTLTLVGMIVAGLYRLGERTAATREGGSNVDDLNRLLQESSVTPEEYELLRRRILAGHVT